MKRCVLKQFGTKSLKFAILDTKKSIKIDDVIYQKIKFSFNEINSGTIVQRKKTEDMAAWGIKGKVTSNSIATDKEILNTTIQNEKNTIFSMVVDNVPRNLLYIVTTQSLTTDGDLINLSYTNDHSDFGISHINCSYELLTEK